MNRIVVCLLSFTLFATIHARALDVIDPTGVSYTGISDDGHFDSIFTAANLFNADMTLAPLGANLASSDFAKDGSGASFVTFQLDRVYTNVASIFYGQRGADSTTVDKEWTISIWTGTNSPFAAEDPGISPDSVIQVNHTPGAIWTEYLLTNTIAGQYFLLKLDQTVLAGNPGGREFRLGANLRKPPTIEQAAQNKTLYIGGKARFDVATSGTPPLIFTWTVGGQILTNGGRISGADTRNLVISDITPEDAGSYSLTITNAYGINTDTVASLKVVAAPTDPVATATISNSPFGYWQLNETSDSTTALDLVGSFNGFYGPTAGIGAAGPRPPAFPGFNSTNTAVQTFAFDTESVVALPPLNLNPTNEITILAWVYSDVSSQPQNPYAGIVYCRGRTTSAGLICSSDGTKLGYQWNGTRFSFDSGLSLPTNQWTLVGLVYTANATTLYCGSTNGLVLSATDPFPQAGQAFDYYTFIGLDTDVGESARTFNGIIDDVAFFDRALSQAEINSIYSAGTGVVPPLQITSQTTDQFAFLGETINLNAVVSGANPVYQWFKGNGPIPGATNAIYVVNDASVQDTGSYYLIATSQVNTVTSAIINVAVANYLVRPLSPSGSLYTGISVSSEYPDPDYVGTNLFDSDLTGVSPGAQLTGNDWADDGDLSVVYLAFQVDGVYRVDAIYYAQRGDSGDPADKITSISIWASQTTAFTATDPGTEPDTKVSTPEIDANILHRYILPMTISGKYFLIKMEQNPAIDGSYIGGNEFRLGTFVTPSTLNFSNSPAGLTLQWVNGTLQEAPSISGPWTTANEITTGMPFSMTKTKSFFRILY